MSREFTFNGDLRKLTNYVNGKKEGIQIIYIDGIENHRKYWENDNEITNSSERWEKIKRSKDINDIYYIVNESVIRLAEILKSVQIKKIKQNQESNNNYELGN
jgi:hypothetical protein